MLCAISNAVPEVPVVSTKTGHIFEKALIEKYINDHGKCPITGESLTADDLLLVKSCKAPKPRHTPATSIPGLLGLLHNEYDATMLETYQLREQLQRARQELAHALYQHDASCRVIARLTREKAAAHAQLESLKSQVESGKLAAANAERVRENGDHDMPDSKRAKLGITSDIVDEIVAKSEQLMEMRKNRDANPERLASREDIAAFSLSATHPLHATTQGGILALALPPSTDGAVQSIATAGADHTVQIYDVASSRVVASLPGHSKKVTAVAYSSADLLISGSADKTVKLWQPSADGAWALQSSLRDFDDSIVRLCVHPVTKYCLSITADAKWHLHDLLAPRCIVSVTDDSAGAAFTCGQVHPDGALVGIGTAAGAVRVWDIKESKFMVEFTEGMEGAVHDLAFNENGYWLATASDKGVQVWDLRKLRMAVEVAPFEDALTSCLAWDHSGKYLACGGPEVKIYNVTALKGKKGGKGAEATLLKSLVDVPSKKGAMCMAFGPLAHTLYVGASDHNLRVFAH